MAFATGTESASASRFAKGPSTRTNGVRSPAASQISEAGSPIGQTLQSALQQRQQPPVDGVVVRLAHPVERALVGNDRMEPQVRPSCGRETAALEGTIHPGRTTTAEDACLRELRVTSGGVRQVFLTPDFTVPA